MSKEAMKLALEALQYINTQDDLRDFLLISECELLESAIYALREALAEQPAQQDIDWKEQYEKQKRRADMWVAKYEADIGPLEKAGPVAYIRVSKTGNVMACAKTGDFYSLPHKTLLYTTPQSAQRKPLTDDFSIDGMFDMGEHSLQIVFKDRPSADKFKAAHGAKENT